MDIEKELKKINERLDRGLARAKQLKSHIEYLESFTKHLQENQDCLHKAMGELIEGSASTWTPTQREAPRMPVDDEN